MINKVVLVGRITKELELKYAQGGNTPYVRFTLAVNRMFTNQKGEREADFINCIVWRKTAENMVNYVGKGSLIGLDGSIQTSSYLDQAGNRVFNTVVRADNVQFLDSRKEQHATDNYSSKQSQGSVNSQPYQGNNGVPSNSFNGYYEQPNSYREHNHNDDLPF